MIANIPGWTSAHRLRGIAYLYVRLEYDADIFPLGIPNVSAVVKGKKVYDARSGLTAWSDNAALCVRDYLASGYGFACSAAELNDKYFNAAANVSNEAVLLPGGGSQYRYTCNGVLDTATVPLENLTSLLTSMAGVVTYVQGKFRLYAGSYDTPVADISPDRLAGDVEIEVRTPRKDLFNAVKGTYLDPGKNWQPTDFPPVVNPTYQTQDGGDQIFKDVELPFTSDPLAAQRIAKLLLEKSRQGLIVQMPVNHHGMQFCAYDVVTLTNPQLGWSAKPFRVVKWAMNEDLSVGLVLQEESAASYAWNSGEATTIDAAPDTNLPNPFTVLPPGAPQVAEALYTTADGGVKSKATVVWDPSEDAFAAEYQVEYKLTAANDWIVAGRTLKEITAIDVFDLAPGVYQFRVKSLSTLGVSSAYAYAVAEVFGVTLPPADVTNYSLNAINNNAHATWDQVPDLDVRAGGYIRIRYTPQTDTPGWESAIDIGPALSGVATSAVLPLLDGTYLIKAVDTAGNESINATTVRSNIANIVKMNQVAVTQQDPTFSGTFTGMEVVDGALRLAGNGLFDSGPGNFDSAPGLFDLAGGSGYVASGWYQFASAIDVGRVTTSRVTAVVEVGVFSEDTLFDDSPGNFDDRPGVLDGGESSAVMVQLEVRTTNDNPSGSPVWSDWQQFFVGDYTCRGYQFRVVASSTDATTNVAITQLRVRVDMPDIIDSGTVATGTGGLTHINFAKTFVIVPTIPGVTIQNAQSGDYEVVSNVTATGFDLGVKNAGSFVARTVGWAASGY